ncbi:MAG: chitobiase/beta-hexosaminidase C-terminal domain-containing protein, partial [Methanobacterium paludis]|nr:chitobiase/beta-hexosaminidase C-terminal domain-containing protein [Methanobacterium paludis]
LIVYTSYQIDPSTLLNGSNATVTVNFNNIWNGTAVVSIDPASGHIPDGTVVNFSSLLGSFDPVSVTTINGTAITTFTANHTGIGVINATAGSTAVSGNVTVYDVPVAGFTANATSGSSPLTVQFTDTSSNVPSSWAWDFNGDGVVDSTDENPTYTYTSSGIYTVVLTVSNAAGSSTVTKTSYIVVDVPVASCTANTTTGNDALTVQFNDTSINTPTSWLWNFGDGSTSTDENPVHNYAKAGNYTVTLTATNDYGTSTLTETDYINIVDTIPTVAASVAGGLYSSTQNVVLTTSDVTATIYYYLNGKGLVYSSPVVIGSNSTLTYFAIDNMGNLSPLYSQAYTIVFPPVANFTSNITSGLDPLTVQFTDTSTGIVTGWAWDFNGDGVIDSTEQNPVWTYAVAGSYNVTLLVSNIGGSNLLTQTDYITVFNSTPPMVTASPDDGVFNSSQSVSLSSDQPNTQIYYTTDGSDPTDASNSNRVPYSAPIPITNTTTLNFAAVNNGGVWSSRYNKTYVIDTSIPVVTVSPVGGIFNSTQATVLNATDADTSATAYYTTDGSDPRTSDTKTVYTTPISINTTTTLRYVAVDLAGNWGLEYNQTYIIDSVAPTVNASLVGGTYNTTQIVTLITDDPTATIYYANDTTDPRTSSTRIEYTGAITISNTTTLRFVAVDLAGNWSPVYLQNYVIGNGTIVTDQSSYTGPSTGTILWSVGTGSWTQIFYSQPVIGSDGTIYVGTENEGYFLAINPNGTVKWSYYVGGTWGIEGSAIIGADGTIYVGTYDGVFYAFNSNGTVKWTYSTGCVAYGSPAIGSDGTIYVGGSNILYAFNPDGTVKWTHTIGGQIEASPVIGADGTI